MNCNDLPNLILGGTNKAGTTSVFRYLSDHPEVCGSNVKETGFFVDNYSGVIDQDRKALGKYFSHCSAEKKIRVEASTSYLALGEVAIPRIQELLDEPRILFILRSPIDRIYSYFNFHSSHLAIPQSISFEQYLQLCQKYDARKIDAKSAPFDEWHLKALAFGKYSRFLNRYTKAFPADHVKTMFFDDLKRDPESFMKEVSKYTGIDTAFYDGYHFTKANVTFSSSHQGMHRFAILLNRKLERFLRQRPAIKSKLVSAYKSINAAEHGYNQMLPETKALLRDYYAGSNSELAKMINRPLPDRWL